MRIVVTLRNNMELKFDDLELIETDGNDLILYPKYMRLIYAPIPKISLKIIKEWKIEGLEQC